MVKRIEELKQKKVPQRVSATLLICPHSTFDAFCLFVFVLFYYMFHTLSVQSPPGALQASINKSVLSLDRALTRGHKSLGHREHAPETMNVDVNLK